MIKFSCFINNGNCENESRSGIHLKILFNHQPILAFHDVFLVLLMSAEFLERAEYIRYCEGYISCPINDNYRKILISKAM